MTMRREAKEIRASQTRLLRAERGAATEWNQWKLTDAMSRLKKSAVRHRIGQKRSFRLLHDVIVFFFASCPRLANGTECAVSRSSNGAVEWRTRGGYQEIWLVGWVCRRRFS